MSSSRMLPILKRRLFQHVSLTMFQQPKISISVLQKKDGEYRVNGNQGVFTTDQEIPDSIDEFLAQYQYEPEELER